VKYALPKWNIKIPRGKHFTGQAAFPVPIHRDSGELQFAEGFYDRYTGLINEFVMYGLFGKAASYRSGDDNEEIDRDV
jgi:hypothetical protein